MIATAKSFHSLIAQDLMSPEPLVIPQESSLKQAAHMLAQSQVSGAPVVDEAGRCIGVLSTTDFMRWVDQEEPANGEMPHKNSSVCVDWAVFNPDSLPADVVSTYMTPDPVTASSEAGIDELARMMLDAHIHRVVILDRKGRPMGIVSSTDILAAVTRGESQL